jgi:cysteine desulfuration protein SufE
MNPREKQSQMIARYLVIDDVQERLALIVERARKLAPLAETERCEANRVQGCSSRVWIVGTIEQERCRFRVDADSTLVKGLAGLLCEVYDDAPPEEVATVEPEVLEALRLSEHLSPTRRHGLEQVRGAIRNFAARALVESTGP